MRHGAGFALSVIAIASALLAAPPHSFAAGVLGDGFVVWESNRTGSWRIWTVRLDGTGLRQLSPEEPGRQHICPHVSPDGEWVAYASFPAGIDASRAPESTGALHLIETDGRNDRVLVPAARTYAGNRAAVWKNADELIYIDPNGRTSLIEIATKAVRPLTTTPAARQGWLINPTLTHATAGTPTFSLYDPNARAILEREEYGGCEPYFTHDGQWGYWVAGAGGPFNRIHLPTRQVTTILQRNDARLPQDRRYCYFPMISRCGLLMAYAASGGEHDQARSDYDVFVAMIDPRTLELIGSPARITSHPAVDRYPDVYLAPLVLGRHFVEAPHTIRFDALGGHDWSYGEGASKGEAAGTHTYTRPGVYEVRATSGGGRELEGRVFVEAARAPKPVAVQVREGRLINVSFDEGIQLATPRAKLASGIPITGCSIATDKRTVRIEAAREIAGADRLELSGIADLAQRPNAMLPAPLDVPAPGWPTNSEELGFLWAASNKPNLVKDPQSRVERSCLVEAHGPARLDRNWAMSTSGGYFAGSTQCVAGLVARCRETTQISIEATIRPGSAPQTGTLIGFFGESKTRDIVLFQDGDSLSVRFRLTGREADQPVVRITRATPGQAIHVVVTYEPGRLAAYVNGEKVVESELVRGNLSRWNVERILFGANREDRAGWLGTIEGVAMYARVLPADEIKEQSRRYRLAIAARPRIEPLILRAKLLAASRPPTLQEIAPYREALAVYEYAVEGIEQGSYKKPRIRVAHWVLLDAQPQPAQSMKPGESVKLVVEPFASNPQIEGIYTADTLPENFAIELYYSSGNP